MGSNLKGVKLNKNNKRFNLVKPVILRLKANGFKLKDIAKLLNRDPSYISYLVGDKANLTIPVTVEFLTKLGYEVILTEKGDGWIMNFKCIKKLKCKGKK